MKKPHWDAPLRLFYGRVSMRGGGIREITVRAILFLCFGYQFWLQKRLVYG